MNCPFCKSESTKVIETRAVDDGQAIKRRRYCNDCGRRYTTFERVETIPLIVRKKDGTKQAFNKEKIVQSMIKACYKRHITEDTIRELATDIEHALWERQEDECSSQVIGEKVMDVLKDIDKVGYVRYAAVYREFGDLNTFMDEIRMLLGEKSGE